jgi:dihydropyrimidine dehydrogenase (NAD+) subunit PreT
MKLKNHADPAPDVFQRTSGRSRVREGLASADFCRQILGRGALSRVGDSAGMRLAYFGDRSAKQISRRAPVTRSADIRPARLSPEAYRERFGDLHPALSANEAVVAASRCVFCYDAPCVAACPTSIDVPLFIRQILTGNIEGSATTILESNIMGGMCARVCPTEILCEGACVMEAAERDPVKIGALQRFATDAMFASQRHPFSRAASSGRRIAVAGSGPAGMACAHKLAMLGHDVTIYESRAKAGGLNEYGIAAYKTVDDFAARELDWILSIGGIAIHTGVVIGKDVQVSDLVRDFDAVFLGLGLQGVNEIWPDARDEPAALAHAVSFIADLRQAEDLASLAIGRRVVVIGGGMTAIDAAVQARRLGAEEATIVYRKGPADMSASAWEQELARKNGVTIRHWARPIGWRVEDGSLAALRFADTRPADALEGDAEFEIVADQAFKAIGQTFEPNPAAAGAFLAALATSGSRIVVDDERRTSIAGIWAGGDCVAGGADLTVHAIEDGKRAAASIDRALRAHPSVDRAF